MNICLQCLSACVMEEPGLALSVKIIQNEARTTFIIVVPLQRHVFALHIRTIIKPLICEQ